MSLSAVPWLPPPQDGDIERAVAAFMEAWAAAWFAAPAEVRVKPHPGRSDRGTNWEGAAGAAAGMTASALARFGLALVGGEAEIDSPADRAVLEQVARTALADLGARLAQAAGEELLREGGHPAPANLILHASLGRDCANDLLVSIAPSTQVALRKTAAGQSRSPKLGRLAESLAPEGVRIGCHLGSATISARELAELGVGDLIALDRRLADELPLTIADRVAAPGSVKVVQDGADIVVRIVQGIAFEQAQ